MAIAFATTPQWESVAWRSESACRDLDCTMFFPVGVTGPAVDQIAAAKAVCRTCTVQRECLEYAITTNQEFGVWGGLTEDERRVLRRKWRAEQRRQRALAAG